MNAAQFWSLAVSAIFVQNLVLVYMLVDGSYFKALKSPIAGLIYGLLVTVAATAASMLSWVVNHFLLQPFSLSWLAPFSFVFVIVVLEVGAQLSVSRYAPKHSEQLSRLLPASAFNCAVMGLVFLNVEVGAKGFWGTAFYGLCAGLGYLAALFISASALERVRFSTPPTVFKGLPIALITAGIIALALMGFSGAVIPY